MIRQATEWWLVRHAPVSNPDGIVYGQLDMAIETPSAEEFQALSAMLPDDPAWMASNLSRTRRTLEGILDARGLSGAGVHEEADFAEQDIGDWEGLPRDEVWTRIRGGGDTWPSDALPPRGERFSDVAVRVRAAADRWSERLGARPVVAVLHAGSIRGFLAAAMRGDARGALSFAVDTLSVTRCDRFEGGHWRVSFVNRTAPRRPR